MSAAAAPIVLLTDFADQAVLLPVAAAVALALLAQGWWRGVAAWGLCVGATLGAMLVLKLIFAACPEAAWLHSPSGHTAASGAVAGGLFGLLAVRLCPRLGWLAVAGLALAVAVPIGVSRVVLGAHSVAEVLLGGTVGIAGALGFTLLAGPPPPAVRLRWTALAAIAAVVLAYGGHLNAEAAIDAAAPGFARLLGICGAG